MAHAKLCDRQRKFCLNLLRGMPKRVAAVKAGYAAKSAATQASQMLALPAVQEFLQDHYRRESIEVEIQRERIRNLMLNMIFCDQTKAFDDRWQVLDKSQMPASVRRLVLAVKVWESQEQGRSVSVKMERKLDVIKAYIKLFPQADQKNEDLGEVAEQVEADFEELIKKLEKDTRPE